MRLRSTGIKILIMAALPVLAACGPQAGDARQPGPIKEDKGEIKMDAGYKTRFADYRRSSFQNAAAQCSGEILWSRELPPEAWMPQAVYLMGGRVVLLSRKGFTLLSPEGDKLFHQEMMTDAPVGVTDSLIYYQDLHYMLSAVDASGAVKLENEYYPGPINGDYPVSLMSAGRSDYLYVLHFNGGAEELPRKIMAKRTVYGSRLAEWTWELEGRQTMPPLYIKEKDLVVVFAGDAIFIDASSGAETARKKMPLDAPLLASAGADGTVYISGSDEGVPAIASLPAVEGDGWKWKGTGSDPALSGVQPPVIGGDGIVYVLAGGDLIAVREGSQQWRATQDTAPFANATAFAGGRIVAAAGTHIFGYDADGEQIFDVEFESPVMAPPVAAGDGTLYILTAKELMRVR